MHGLMQYQKCGKCPKKSNFWGGEQIKTILKKIPFALISRPEKEIKCGMGHHTTLNVQ